MRPILWPNDHPMSDAQRKTTRRILLTGHYTLTAVLLGAMSRGDYDLERDVHSIAGAVANRTTVKLGAFICTPEEARDYVLTDAQYRVGAA